MTGRKTGGEFCVFDTDKVVDVQDDESTLIGFVDRREGARFAMRVRMTDSRILQVIAAINRIRKEKQNLGPVVGPGHTPPDPQAADGWQEDNDTEEGVDDE